METSRLEIVAYLLPFFLILLATGAATHFARRQHAEIRFACRRHWKSVVLASLVLSFLMFDLPFLMNRAFDLTTPAWKFWLATVSGNWSPDSFPGLLIGAGGSATEPAKPFAVLDGSGRYWFAMSASLAFWINNLIVLGLLGWVWRLAVERRKAMDFAAALRLKESFARTAVQDLVEEQFQEPDRQRVIDLFDAAMTRAQRDLEKHLPKMDEKRGPEILAGLRPVARTGKRPSASAA